MKSKRKLVIVLVISILLINLNAQFAYSDNIFNIEAKAGLLIDAASGKVIYEKNPHERLSPASITKVMVLLLAMESLDSNKISLNDQLVVSENAASMGGSQIYLEQGEIQKVEDIIRAICLRSANDGAVALGEHIAGSEELFIKMMNDRAKELGMTNTQFLNITGLDEEGHYTSAYDIGLMSRELLKYPKIHDWLTLWIGEIKVGKKKDVTQTLVNTNRLIHDYEGANGIKTGFTNEAEYCLSASAKRGNLSLISIVMGSKTSNVRFREAKKLLDYGFANYNSIPIAKKDDIVKKIPVSKGKINEVDIYVEEDFSVLIEKGVSDQVEREIVLPDLIDAPVEENQKVGEMIIKVEGNEVDRIDLIVKTKIDKASIFDIFKKIITKLSSN